MDFFHCFGGYFHSCPLFLGRVMDFWLVVLSIVRYPHDLSIYIYIQTGPVSSHYLWPIQDLSGAGVPMAAFVLALIGLIYFSCYLLIFSPKLTRSDKICGSRRSYSAPHTPYLAS